MGGQGFADLDLGVLHHDAENLFGQGAFGGRQLAGFKRLGDLGSSLGSQVSTRIGDEPLDIRRSQHLCHEQTP
jgi:hypothetical protein